MTELKPLRETAERAAREAGKILREGREHLKEVDFLDQRDVKLRADQESETLIREILGQDSGYAVVGEEQGGDDTLTQRYDPYWVVDPLDGTFNYMRGAPQCCVSIGLLRGETPVLGVIYDFNADEMFSGIVAEGAYLNGDPLQPSWATSVEQAALVTGFPSGMEKSSQELEKFIELIQPYKKVRMLGSAALALAYVAVGRYDVYYEQAIRLWDVAAGLAILQAAGGGVRMSHHSSGKRLAYDIWGIGGGCEM